jgi:hypothetical protein
MKRRHVFRRAYSSGWGRPKKRELRENWKRRAGKGNLIGCVVASNGR